MSPTWQQGDVQLYLGDCLQVMPTLAGNGVDAVITDPPYNAENIGARARIYEGGAFFLTDEEYRDWAAQWFGLAFALASQLVFTPGIGQMCYYPQPKWALCWHKPSAVGFNRMGGYNAWEPIFVYGKPTKRLGQDYFYLNPRNFLTGPQKEHPCPKPIELYKWLVAHFSKNGEVICDPFMGSGTTGVACVQTGRKFIGIEIEPKYFDIAVKRISEAQMQLRLGI